MKLNPVTYIGERYTDLGGTNRARVWRFDMHPATLLRPDASQRLINHSPTGFEWEFYGSGPAQLALALCLDVTQDGERAKAVYQEFKSRVVAKLPHERWTLTTGYILGVIEQIEHDANPAGSVPATPIEAVGELETSGALALLDKYLPNTETFSREQCAAMMAVAAVMASEKETVIYVDPSRAGQRKEQE